MSDPAKRKGMSPRGWGLVLMGLACLARAWSYLEPGLTAPPNQLAFVGEIIPFSSYSLVWAGAGVICFASVAVRRVMPWGFGLFAGLHLLWALSFFASWLVLESPRAWVSAISYITLAGLSMILARMIDPQDVLTPRERSSARFRARRVFSVRGR